MAALRTCVHCGICLPVCPTYRVLGEEMDSPRGRLYLIRAAAEGRIGLTPSLTRHLDLCLGCRACETACPSGVPFGSLLETARGQVERQGRSTTPRLLGRLIFALFPRPDRLGAALGALGLYQRSGLQRLVRAAGVLRVAPRLAAMEALLPVVPRRADVPVLTPARGTRRGRVALLTGCVQRHLYPDVNRATARLLSLAGWDVVAPPAQGCCGGLDLHAGRLDELRLRARALTAALPDDVDWVVTNAAGCGSAMREYAHWLPGDAGVARLAGRVRDVSQLLVDAELPLGRLGATVTYHDACHLVHGQKVRNEPRALLARIPGLRLVELADSELCCGSAGIYNLLEPAMAERLLAMKIERIVQTGARIVVAGNPGCLLQIAKGVRERGLDLEVLHPVQVLARALDQGRSFGEQDLGR
ncbi:MAG: 4Fe-4S dicluster domain-containing protein [Candidatus Rokubacteria bacterium]|nr:4Fe-4S dicluster domain-containing protein [Candidatus Rokubacteria bacterium]MBI3826582.1 4Fe-4S dicluster domain-containing protein [Candidatus Rokubacteria bacterium]